MAGFAELGVSETRVELLRGQGIVTPTPVQTETIPLVYAGRDVVGQAQTGTGKTLAFVLPMLDRVRAEAAGIQGLIVTPTRELALQITAEIRGLIGESGTQVLTVYGGQDVEAQLHRLKGDIHIVVATPGRLLDHLRRETVKLDSVKMLVLDEADQMLQMGFLGEVEEVLRATPYKKQTLLFSATMPGKIRELAGRILRDPAHVTVQAERVTVKETRQWVIETSDRNKMKTLVRLIEDQHPYLAMIFCRTKRRANALNASLQELGFASEELHGDLTQAKREQVMRRFREAKLQLLVATDVAARGLDVEGVTHVFNYDVPHDVESYIHRIGRTGRAGESGLAITLVAPKDRQDLTMIEVGIAMGLERRTEEGAPIVRGGGKAAPARGERRRQGAPAYGGRTAVRGSGSGRQGEAARSSGKQSGSRGDRGRNGSREESTREHSQTGPYVARKRSSETPSGSRDKRGRNGNSQESPRGGDTRSGGQAGSSRRGSGSVARTYKDSKPQRKGRYIMDKQDQQNHPSSGAANSDSNQHAPKSAKQPGDRSAKSAGNYANAKKPSFDPRPKGNPFGGGKPGGGRPNFPTGGGGARRGAARGR